MNRPPADAGMSTAAFVWHDGERVIRFAGDALGHAWQDALLLTTARARSGVPAVLLESASAVLDVPPGGIPDAAAALVNRMPVDARIVAWGGGRVIDTAKALAS